MDVEIDLGAARTTTRSPASETNNRGDQLDEMLTENKELWAGETVGRSEGAGCTELIFPSYSEPDQVDLLADTPGP